MWITEEDLARLRLDLLDPLPGTPTNLTESSSSDPGRIGGVRPPSPPWHDTMAHEDLIPTCIQPPRQAKTKDSYFRYTASRLHLATVMEQDCKVVKNTWSCVKIKSKLTNLMKITRIEEYNDKYGSNPQGIRESSDDLFEFYQIRQ